MHLQDSISAWQLQWELPSKAMLQPGQAVCGAILSAQGSAGRNVSATKLPEAAAIAGNGGSSTLQVSAQLEQQQAAGNFSSASSADLGDAAIDISISNVSFNGIVCSPSTQSSSSSSISPSAAVGSLTFQPSTAGSQSDAALNQQCSFDLSQAEDSWQQAMEYVLPSACNLQFCCGAHLAASPSGTIDAYGFPASQSADRIRNFTSPSAVGPFSSLVADSTTSILSWSCDLA